MPDYQALVIKFPTFFPENGPKFLCGDEVTIYDMSVAGLFTNLVLNPNSKDPELWKKSWENTPLRIRKYAEDFKEVFKEYLDHRNPVGTV